MRAGELAALRVGRLDLLAGRAEVVESITEVAGKLVAGPTKTNLRRTVRLPRGVSGKQAVAALERAGFVPVRGQGL
jgi:hypothetical protein